MILRDQLDRSTGPTPGLLMIDAWREVASRFEGGSLLIGNGASRSVWDPFGYDSLFEQAREVDPGLAEESTAVFNEFDTHDFELILRQVQASVRVLGAIGQDVDAISELHEEIRLALIDAIHAVHVDWKTFESVVVMYRAALLGHDWVFSLNYDLLTYWAIMYEEDGKGFKDAFWGPKGLFDRDDAEFWDDTTKVVYLHGGLHLERSFDGRVRKRDTDQGDLLATFGPDLTRGTTPLFVSEGTADEKLRAILRSEYLAWCLECLEDLEGPLIIFGVGSNASDDHVIQAINRSRANPIGLSAFAPTDELAFVKTAHARFPHKKVVVFNSSTHPLGDPGLSIA